MKKVISSIALSSVCLFGLTAPTFAMSNPTINNNNTQLSPNNIPTPQSTTIYTHLGQLDTVSDSPIGTFKGGHATIKASNDSNAEGMNLYIIKVNDDGSKTLVYNTLIVPETSILHGISLPSDGNYYIELSGILSFGYATLYQQ